MTHGIVAETRDGTLVSSLCDGLDAYPLALHFALESLRWNTGGDDLKVLFVEDLEVRQTPP